MNHPYLKMSDLFFSIIFSVLKKMNTIIDVCVYKKKQSGDDDNNNNNNNDNEKK